jgi:hypothetical protein
MGESADDEDPSQCRGRRLRQQAGKDRVGGPATWREVRRCGSAGGGVEFGYRTQNVHRPTGVCERVTTRWPDSRTALRKPGSKNGARRRVFYEDRSARISIMVGGSSSRPDTLKQTDQRQSCQTPCRRGGPYVFNRHADPAKEAAHHRGVGFDPSLGQKAIAERLKRDVRFLGSRGLQKVPVRHQLGGAMAAMSDRLSRAIPFNPLKPFDRHGLADRVMTRGCAAAHLAPLHRINHPVAQVLRIRLRHPCWPPPSPQVESKSPRFGNPHPPIQAKVSML